MNEPSERALELALAPRPRLTERRMSGHSFWTTTNKDGQTKESTQPFIAEESQPCKRQTCNRRIDAGDMIVSTRDGYHHIECAVLSAWEQEDREYPSWQVTSALKWLASNHPGNTSLAFLQERPAHITRTSAHAFRTTILNQVSSALDELQPKESLRFIVVRADVRGRPKYDLDM